MMGIMQSRLQQHRYHRDALPLRPILSNTDGISAQEALTRDIVVCGIKIKEDARCLRAGSDCHVASSSVDTHVVKHAASRRNMMQETLRFWAAASVIFARPAMGSTYLSHVVPG